MKYLEQYIEYSKALENSSFEEAFFSYKEYVLLQEWEINNEF